MDRIFNIFRAKKPLIVFTTAGYPDMASSEAGIDLAIENGADIIELGVPFSDPMADGPVIAAASQQTAARGVGLSDVLALAGRLRAKHPETGLILFSYLNPLLRFGYDRVCAELARLDADGVLPVDLPLEEREELLGKIAAGIAVTFTGSRASEQIQKQSEFAVETLAFEVEHLPLVGGVRPDIDVMIFVWAKEQDRPRSDVIGCALDDEPSVPLNDVDQLVSFVAVTGEIARRRDGVPVVMIVEGERSFHTELKNHWKNSFPVPDGTGHVFSFSIIPQMGNICNLFSK